MFLQVERKKLLGFNPKKTKKAFGFLGCNPLPPLSKVQMYRPHQLEFPIWWYETDTSLGFEFAEFHTLMECTVVYCNPSILSESV